MSTLYRNGNSLNRIKTEARPQHNIKENAHSISKSTFFNWRRQTSINGRYEKQGIFPLSIHSFSETLNGVHFWGKTENIQIPFELSSFSWFLSVLHNCLVKNPCVHHKRSWIDAVSWANCAEMFNAFSADSDLSDKKG